MKTVTIGKHQVTFYDSIRKLPIRRYQKFNKHMIIAAEVGNSIEDYDKRMGRALGYLSTEDTKSAIIEITNQRQTLHNALEGYSPSSMALATMVYSIDKRIFEDYEEDTLNEVLDLLDKIGFSQEQLNETIKHVKKN
jgi:hypothetical protein